VHRVRCKQFPPLVSTKGDEEQGIMSENRSQSSRDLGIFAHASL
jgi:hypothetical protein